MPSHIIASRTGDPTQSFAKILQGTGQPQGQPRKLGFASILNPAVPLRPAQLPNGPPDAARTRAARSPYEQPIPWQGVPSTAIAAAITKLAEELSEGIPTAKVEASAPQRSDESVDAPADGEVRALLTAPAWVVRMRAARVLSEHAPSAQDADQITALNSRLQIPRMPVRKAAAPATVPSSLRLL